MEHSRIPLGYFALKLFNKTKDFNVNAISLLYRVAMLKLLSQNPSLICGKSLFATSDFLQAVTHSEKKGNKSTLAQ